MLDTYAERYALYVDSSEVLTEIECDYDTTSPLNDVWDTIISDRAPMLYSKDLECAAYTFYGSTILGKLALANLIDSRSLWYREETDYVSTTLTLDFVNVEKSFVVETRDGDILPVPAGTGVVFAHIGDDTRCWASSAPLSLDEDIHFVLENVGTFSHARAHCHECERSWHAEAGSWEFTLDEPNGSKDGAFEYDDMEPDDSLAVCPLCHPSAYAEEDEHSDPPDHDDYPRTLGFEIY